MVVMHGGGDGDDDGGDDDGNFGDNVGDGDGFDDVDSECNASGVDDCGPASNLPGILW